MNVKIGGKNLSFDFIHSHRLYAGWLEGGPGIGNNTRVIDRAIKSKDTYVPNREDIPTHVIIPADVDTKLLPGVCNIAWVTEYFDERHAVVIWFSGDNPIKSLEQQLDLKTWKKVSKKFSW